MRQIREGLDNFLVFFVAQFIQQQRQNDGHREANHQVHEAQDDRILEGLPEYRAAEHLGENAPEGIIPG